ncbi:putative disease resistance RPP13-like protein 3 [Brachypodium distachyon]|uniref:AAA+ ATPase domain-containing protein n=1 Tax=Brachypodium distachyon TaxID=15368 RepID=I1IV27_BRADI|nr:putative disease resistance RPP13-like protein 3 [Brachypodium distachyon]XP_014758422.1 putative disease resistance RPP13-like protein 3 [Brachypodium distachyon]XP_024319231.1 putative disease resistance RPP13-like protein 3 [Brachypodium distachyon]KQJ92573.1 hypothetical protein BRADI_4g44550v3 [Brachypodium distachyon]KQJ92574.1 hypothetical protein BRADI_4g44550v3 [Brachypodium distachyon]KQJ92575.1 hypothetical protein BRADI_4g44550v3 [Brachypodium distachyon]PNT65561.1 hypothetical|eukprot:XP_010238809.1 putative disease resistance RPP13-like protein 3 [Brachypodium distachyon]
MELATGAMSSLLPKLAELLQKEYNLQTGLKKDVQSLSRELERIEVALAKVAEVPLDQLDKQVRLWARNVKQLSYDMEDIVDSFMVRVEGSEPDADLKSSKRFRKKIANFFKKGKTRHQIADKIQDIKVRVKEVTDLRDRYKVDDVHANQAATNTIDPRMINLFKDQKELVGIEEPRKDLIKRLMEWGDVVSNSKLQLKIVSIFGFGGLGKTTLAKAVYDKLQEEFVCKAFISVGQKPNLKKVFMDILRQLDKNSYLNATMLDEVQLIDELRELLENKRYLIVIDDIWDKSSWNIMKCALIDSNCGSRIITTTRIFEVAEEADDVYKQKPLSSATSKELFYTRLSIGKCKITSGQPIEISEKILQKCGGVPLAIITIASLLASKPWEDWSEVYDSIGFGDGANIHVDNTRKILLYSYYDLPCYLRACLLHLSIYPEDHEIQKDTLIWKWVAEGFVHEKPGMGLFEIGERYFNELINRSLIQPVEEPYKSIIYACGVHDLVLDMICHLSKEENFITVHGSSKTEHQPSQSNVRRLAVQNIAMDEEPNSDNTEIRQVRSFNAIMCDVKRRSFLSGFQGLRILSMERCAFINDSSYHLENLGRLLQLRYLGLLGTPIRKLPKEIGNLRFLQVLDLRLTGIKELPESVGRLRRLKCLRLSRGFKGALGWIGNLVLIEELLLPYVSLEIVKELAKLTELREYGVCCEKFDDSILFNDMMKSLEHLQKLQAIQFECYTSWPRVDQANCVSYVLSHHLRRLELWVAFEKLPAWINSSSLPNLSHLSVGAGAVEAQDMEVLGRFPELVYLHLETLISIPDIVGGGAFPKLRYYHTNASARFLQGAMPSLECVVYYIRDECSGAKFERDIGSIGNLPCLDEVRLAFYRCASVTREKGEAALRQAVEVHPNNITVTVI